MGAPPARGVTRRRSRPRAWLALARVSNLPTIWTNVLAGATLAADAVPAATCVGLAAAVSALYTGGMFLNDAFDRGFDAVHRRDRPIPAGEAGAAEVFTIGFALLGVGVLGVGLAGGARAAAWAAALAACVLYYDWHHKQNPIGPLVMGVCRGLVYLTAAAVAAGIVTSAVIAGAVVVTAYVAGFTLLAKYGDDRWGWAIAWLIAGISIVDAAAIATRGFPVLTLIALAGFPLTLLAQRWVRGT